MEPIHGSAFPLVCLTPFWFRALLPRSLFARSSVWRHTMARVVRSRGAFKGGFISVLQALAFFAGSLGINVIC
jgi:hypothetical protein